MSNSRQNEVLDDKNKFTGLIEVSEGLKYININARSKITDRQSQTTKGKVSLENLHTGSSQEKREGMGHGMTI